MPMSQEIEWLLKEKYGVEKNAPAFNESLDEIKSKYPWGDAFSADFARLEAGEPLAYVIGSIPFLGCTISLESHPLIPRVETEYWVEGAIEVIRGAAGGRAPRILDLCAGSGCIGVAVAKALPDAYVDFAEIDLSHIPTIEKNLAQNGIAPDRTTIYRTDLFQDMTEVYDFILTNPPYIDPALNRTDESVVTYEPARALFGGEDGMEIIERIIHAAPSHLDRGGQLWIEHEPEQVAAIATLAAQNGFSVSTHLDQYQTPRFSILVLQ